MADKPSKADDLDLFKQAMQDATPIKQDQSEPYKRKPPPRPIEQPDYLKEDDDSVSLSESEVKTEEFLDFARPGVQQRVLQELRRGHIEVELEVDLHGLTVAYAKETLDDFLRECRARRIRCARIIHGKGKGSENRQPVLKSKVNYWLRLREEVLAFCSATRRDGGTGAAYVLLRNPRKMNRRG